MGRHVDAAWIAEGSRQHRPDRGSRRSMRNPSTLYAQPTTKKRQEVCVRVACVCVCVCIVCVLRVVCVCISTWLQKKYIQSVHKS